MQACLIGIKQDYVQGIALLYVESSHTSLLSSKRDSSAPSGQIVLCSDIVFTSESRGSRFEISDLTQHLALHYHGQTLPDSTVIPPVLRLSEMKYSISNNAEIEIKRQLREKFSTTDQDRILRFRTADNNLH